MPSILPGLGNSSLPGLGGSGLSGLQGLSGITINPLAVRVPKVAYTPKERNESDSPVQQGMLNDKHQTRQEGDYLGALMEQASAIVQPPLSALGYLGTSVLDALAGRRVRAGLAILSGQAQDKNRWSELVAMPVISDLFGVTDPEQMVTGKDLLGGWDDENTVLDGLAGFAVEVLTDPITYTPGVLLGAAGKGAKIAKAANMQNKILKHLTKVEGRLVGPREGFAKMTLADAVVLSNGNVSDLSKMNPKLRAKWDKASKVAGYDDIDSAMRDLKGKTLGGRIGFTPNPIGDATSVWTPAKGSLAEKVIGGEGYLRGVDTVGRYIKGSAAGKALTKALSPAARGAATAAGQSRLSEVADDVERGANKIRLATVESHYVLTAHGLDAPMYRDAIRGSVEKAIAPLAKKGRHGASTISEAQHQAMLASMERDVDEIIKSNMEAAGIDGWKEPKKNPAYSDLRAYLEGVWRETADDLLGHKVLGLGDKHLDDLRAQYLRRSTNKLPDPKYYKYNPPTHITKDLRRILKSTRRIRQGKDGRPMIVKAKKMADDEISKLTPEQAAREAYGTMVDEALKYKAEQAKAAKGSHGSGLPQRTFQTSDETQIRRLPFLKNIPAGTPWIAGASQDTRLSGPLAEHADNVTHRVKIIYEEGFYGNWHDLRKAERRANEAMTQRPNSPGYVAPKKAKTKAAPKGPKIGDDVQVDANGVPTNGLTAEMVADLSLVGFLKKDIEKMTPQEAWDWIPDLHKNRPPQGKIVVVQKVPKKKPRVSTDHVEEAIDGYMPEASEFAPFTEDQKWGDLADTESIPFSMGRKADDLLGPDDSRRLNEWLNIQRAARDQSLEIANFLHGLDPRYSYHQIPLFKNDPALDFMEFRLATHRTKAMARAALMLAGDGVDTTLTHSTQGKTVIKALREARFHGDQDTLLKAFFDHNIGQAGKDPAFAKQLQRDHDTIFGANQHERLIDSKSGTGIPADLGGKKPKNVKYRGRKKNYVANPDWIKREVEREIAKMKYGLRPPKKVKIAGVNKKYARLKAQAERLIRVKQKKYMNKIMASQNDEASKAAKAAGKKAPRTPDLMPFGSGVNLTRKDLQNLAQTALSSGIKLRPETLKSIILDAAWKQFVKRRMQPYRINMDVANDMRKALDFSDDAAAVRNFTRVWDQLTNTWKGGQTSQFLAYHARNLQTLVFMDFFFGEGGGEGLIKMFSPKRIKRFMQSYKWARQLHGGETMEGIADAPFFKGTDFKGLAKRIGMDPSKHSSDEIATRYVRAMAAASDTTPKYMVGQFAEITGAVPESVSAVAHMIPGEADNVESFSKLWEALKEFPGRVAKPFREAIKKRSVRGIDWSFVNPAEIRGGFAERSNAGVGSQFALQRGGERLGQFTEDVGRSATWLRMVMHNAADEVTAAAKTNAMHVDFRKLTGFEKKVMRRLVPFYSYSRKMAEFFIRDLMEHPGGRTGLIMRAVNNSTGEGREQSVVPQQLAGQLAVPLYRNGNVKAFLRPDVPIEVINEIFTAGPDSYSTFQNTVLGWAGQMHVIPKSVIETAFGKSTFQKGRNLEDLYSRIGVKDPILNQIVMASPFARYITTYGPRGTLFDDRKTAVEKFSSIALGLPVSSIDMDKATGEAIDSALKSELRNEDGVTRAERYYAYDESQLSERGKELVGLQNKLSSERGKIRRKIKKDAERASKLSQGSMPFDSLTGRPQ